MYVDVKALVIKEQKKGENGKLLTIITPSRGALTVSVKGGVSVSSRFFAPCQLFAYSDMTLFKRGNYYTLIEAKIIDVFFELNKSLTTLSLACWMCDVMKNYSIGDEEQGEQFRLLLNSLWYLSRSPEKHKIIKTVFELRTLFLSGFCPEFTCSGCGEPIENEAVINCETGEFFCLKCFPETRKAVSPYFRLTKDMISFMMYIACCPPKKIFAFMPGDDTESALAPVSERFFISMSGINSDKLTFYKNTLLD